MTVATTSLTTVQVSVVIPVRNGRAHLEQTLPALLQALPPAAEVIVSDDGSEDGSGEAARRLGARVLENVARRGPAAARNRGAAMARGERLVFMDADCRVRPDTLARLLAALDDSAIAAAYGSYDDAPAARTWVSLYKNLAHHFVHQRSGEEASTFWAGCGVVRRSIFETIGGFDESYTRPSIEDVELGYRLRALGHRIRLVKAAQVTHLKRWTLASWLRTDLVDRAMPWAALVRAGRGLPRDLNFTFAGRAATAAAGAAVVTAVAIPFAAGARASLVAVALSLVVVCLVLDHAFLGFVVRRVSVPFAMAAALLQFTHRVVALLGFMLGYVAARGPGRRPRPADGVP